MIQKFWEEAEEDEQFWDGGQFGSVSKPDVKALLEGSSINSNVVNAYIDIIKGDLEKSGIRNQGIMTTYVLDSVRDTSPRLKYNNVFEPMMTLLGHCDNIFIPLITTEDYHSTMLRLNKKAKEWIHYNPMRKRTNPEKGKGYENAKEVVSLMGYLIFVMCIDPQ
ncbi:uncharacterized protein LOC133713165 [Rosa rugosa]|uniref:uncharacterized protein LOC133713165 n=1 Tax=Rosa rugosa TaxID=74645 RepID=UPI002B414841|nr:uncharacterized protein LOC133713165 [Rosa rugosa]XP_061995265.1 uncharacterized protein LOC133713165 [Rosa rugosa]